MAARAPVDSRIFEGKQPGDPASFLVVFRDEADLAGAAAISDRTERIRFVAEALKAQADLSQAPLRARLAAAGIAFRPYFLVNMIEVEAPRALAEEIAGSAGRVERRRESRPKVALEPRPREPGAGSSPPRGRPRRSSPT